MLISLVLIALIILHVFLIVWMPEIVQLIGQ